MLGKAIGFVATTLLARRLGADAFGYLGFAAAVIAYLRVGLIAGFEEIGAREVARAPARATELAADVVALRVLLSLGGLVLVVAAGRLVDPPVRGALLAASGLSLVVLALDPTWVYKGLSRIRTAAWAFLISQLIYLGGVFMLVESGADVVRVPLIQFGAELVAAILLLALLFGKAPTRPRLTGGMFILRQSGFITASRLLRTVMVTFGLLLLATLAGTTEVGLYTAAYRVCMLVTMIAVAAQVAYMPAVTMAAVMGVERLSAVLTASVALTASVIAPLVVGGIVLASPLLVLLFGADYAPASRAFQVLLASIGVMSIRGASRNVFVALHQTKREMLIFAAGAATTVVLTLVLIPRYALVGAASAMLAAEGLILVACAVSLYRSGLRVTIAVIYPSLVASVVMGVALVPMAEHLPIWSTISGGGFIYLVVFAATGGISALQGEANV